MYKAQCETCGAPLKRTKEKGKFICEYCGAVYYDDSFTESTWEDDSIDHDLESEDKVIQDKLPFDMRYLLIGSLIILVTCLFVFLTGKANYKKKYTVVESIEKPQMLDNLPSVVEAGKLIPYKDWEIFVDSELEVQDNKLFIELSIQNWNDEEQVLRYIPNSIRVYDDLGNEYPIFIGNCDIDLPYLERQLTFDPREKITFQSSNSWCNREEYLPSFFGVIPIDANRIYIYIDKFGVFENMKFKFDI